MKNIITNASARTLDTISGTLPDMQNVMTDWFQTITFTLIKKASINFQVQETRTPIVFQGVVENIKPSDLEIRPMGERKWRYISVWATPDLQLSPDDIFQYQLVNYRVMSKNDWSQYGYVQYEAMEDYTP